MTKYMVTTLKIEGTLLIENRIAQDNRGSFIKYYERDYFAQNGIEIVDSEDFISISKKNVIRGMHFQLYHPQIKLVNVIKGGIYDVVVDLRKDSKTYGQWEGIYLSQETNNSLLIPKGCAHGFLTMEEDTIVNYKCHGKYDLNTDTGIMWNDPDIAIDWPIDDLKEIIVGKRDMSLLSFSEFDKKCKFEY